jgi:hypothetical protein
VPRPVAAELVKPAAAVQVGARLGRLAAQEAKARGALADVRLRGAAAGTAADVREVRGTLTSPYVSGSAWCVRRARAAGAGRDRPRGGRRRHDRRACGGGAPCGNGLRTLVIEQLFELGGVQTAGMICGYYYGNQRGFTKEIDEGVKATGRYKSQAKAEWYRASIRKAGGEIWFGSMAVGAVMEGKRLRGLVVVTPGGQRGVVLTRR